jgi:hypothetical protein
MKYTAEMQAERIERERARIILFGASLMNDRIVGRWSNGVTGEELCKHLYPDDEGSDNE